MIKKQKVSLISGLLFIILIAVGFSIAKGKTEVPANLTNAQKKTHLVTLKNSGFSPNEIIINKGDGVKFVSDLGKAFWPASNLHPTHTIYPEFDPQKTVEADQSWIFAFTKVGEWKYHDHLNPLYKGKIIVKEEKKEVTTSCKEANVPQKLKCYEELVNETLTNQGLKESFEILAELFQKDPQFASNCHSFSHTLGEKAYQLFSARKDFQLSDKSSYCGYGFYHGFMETLLQKTNDMNEARRFCEYADKQLKATNYDAGGACYHGIGHGAVDGSDPRTWGNPQAMIKTGINLCEMVSNDENPPPRYGKLYRCVSGVFNGLEILSSSNQYKLSIDKNDPFSICKNQSDRFKEACFTQFVVAVLNITGNNFAQSANIIDTIKEDDFATPALQTLVIEFANIGKTNYQQTINFCRRLSGRFQIPCINAFAEGLLKYGQPEKEYVQALSFCNSNLLSNHEKSSCFERVLSLLRIWYTVDKAYSICQQVEPKYRWQNCQYN